MFRAMVLSLFNCCGDITTGALGSPALVFFYHTLYQQYHCT